MIEEYNLGYIVIDGERYGHDVEVRWTNEVLPWPLKEQHLIDTGEISRAVGQNPEIIVIGTGKSGLAKVGKEAQDFIKEKGIELIIDRTEEAIKTFNVINEASLEEEGIQKRVIGFFCLAY
ncbi:hypothetical protein KKC00_00235 [Patescibacteria group bacterium]|nr:hypothetical protein [Patescibacteria group bacterium]